MIRSFVLFLSIVAGSLAQNAPNWERWQFLIGDWVGEGSGQPGLGTGGFSLRPDLDGRVLVRTNRADYPATKDRSAYSHRDLMVIYPEGPAAHAVYFDNEGHVIHYTAEIGENRITFISNAEPKSPRFRLTYTKVAEGKVGIHFEIAPPGKPEAFAPYIEATARRK